MFEIRSNFKNSYFFIADNSAGNGLKYLHCDGRVINVCEYFESEKAAQKVLDKFQPKPKHEWVHGDIFELMKYGFVMMYVHLPHEKSRVIHLNHIIVANLSAYRYLSDAKFLFNIRDKI